MCRALWNTVSDELFHSDVLSEIDFMNSTKESENKNAECISYKGKFFEDEGGEIFIKCFSCLLRAHMEYPRKKSQSICVTFINRLQVEMVFSQS